MSVEEVVHIYNGVLLSHKTEQNTVICRNMDGHTDSHSQWCKSDRKWQISYDTTYTQNLKCFHKCRNKIKQK